MTSNTLLTKASKGTVQVISSNGRLQLRFRWAGKRQYLSIGLPDTSVNRIAAGQKANQIYLDIVSGNFDQSLTKYKPQSASSIATPDIPPALIPTASELWQQYREYKASSLKATTQGYHESLARLLDKIPATSVLEALEVKSQLEKVTTIYQTKRILNQLCAACKWAVKHRLLEFNPYEGMANEMPKFRYQLEPKPNAFSEEERELIIQSFKNHQGNWNGKSYAGFSYAHYAPLVEFWFLTGCRPSEAIGLQWKHISADCNLIYFRGAITKAGTGKPIWVNGSKNNKTRTFPCSIRLQELLISIRPENAAPDAFVFPSPEGKAIIYDNFCKRAWKKIVDPVKPGTTPYSCRDTFITTQILKRIPETAIAEWCDTSVEMIQKHYADFLKMLSLRPID